MTTSTATDRTGTWHDYRWLSTHLAIMQAARTLRVEGHAVTTSALAVRSGYTRRTVQRHFPRPTDALQLMSTPEQFELYMECVARRPADEPTMCVAVHAFLDALRLMARDPEAIRILKDKAHDLVSDPAGAAHVAHDFRVNWQDPLTRELARRAGRARVTGEDVHAAKQVFTLCPAALETWALESFSRSIADVAEDSLRFNGHTTDGSPCPVAEHQQRR